jgi:hypothetical protein
MATVQTCCYPLTAAGQGTPATLVLSGSDKAVETLVATALREGDLDASFGECGKVSGYGIATYAPAS